MGSVKLVAIWALVGMSLLASALIVVSLPTQESSLEQKTVDQLGTPDSTSTRQPSIFDFSNYKRLFRRAYTGLEEAVRMKYFFARAMRVFITAVRYRHAQQLYYFAINKFSDTSPQELDKMINLDTNREAEAEAKEPEAPQTFVDFDSSDLGDNVEDSLRQLAAKHQDRPVFRELSKFLDSPSGQNKRKKRDTSQPQQQPQELRHLPMNKLISTGSNVKLDPKVRAKMVNWVPSDNEDYEDIEPISYGLVDEQEPIELRQFKLDLMSENAELGMTRESAPAKKDQLPDKVLIDLRKTKCFFHPRDQGRCGSCYAFALITMAEWLYCMQTGKLVAFSEQYVIDCGKEFIDGLNGCRGGSIKGGSIFLHNFGLELRQNYPFMRRERRCPYSKHEPLNTTGYIRTNMPNLFLLRANEMVDALKYGPLYVLIKADRSFLEYGGGLRGVPCSKEFGGNHAVVVIGHGRENGREYWLIRNSHGVDWGENGYYKLDKSVGGICGNEAFAIGTRNGYHRKMEARFNPDYTIPVQERLEKANSIWNPDNLPIVNVVKPTVVSLFTWIESSFTGLLPDIHRSDNQD